MRTILGLALFFQLSAARSQSVFDFLREPISKFTQFKPGASNFVRLPNGNVIFTRYTPAKDNLKPTVVLMNGLPDTLNDWGIQELLLIQKGYGVLTFDFRGQGYTLAFNAPHLGDLRWQAQVEDVKQLIDFFNLKKVIVAGLSYGGGIALAFAGTYPERVEKIIAFAPFIEPVQPTEDFLNDTVRMTQKIFPSTDGQQLYESLFRMIVYGAYPLTEPSVLAHPLKPEAITRMALGIKSLNLTKMLHRLPAKSLNLVGGRFDSSVPLEVIERLWLQTPLSVRQSYTTIDSGHRITTWRSRFAANLVEAIEQNKIYDPYNRLQLENEAGLTFKPLALIGSQKIKLCRDLFF